MSFLDRDGQRQKYEFSLRWVYRYEMQHLLELAGFEVVSLAGDFEGAPFDELSTEMVWTARRAENGRKAVENFTA